MPKSPRCRTSFRPRVCRRLQLPPGTDGNRLVIGGFCNTLALARGIVDGQPRRVPCRWGSCFMNLKLRVACAALLASAAAPAWALQLGQIQVKSALNQPLVAAIPLHPENLTELEGLTVGLAPAEDFARAGLQVTPTDQTLQFHVVTDNNGQKLILVTSTQPISDPYLDFLLQVNTREGKQVREFVVLLNPVIAAPAPGVQAAPVASAPAATPPAQPAQLPPSSAFAQPAPQPQARPPAAEKPAAPPPAPPAPPPAPRPAPQAAPD